MKKIVGLILLLIMLQNTTTANAAMSSNAIASKPELLDGITIYNQGDYRSEYNDKKNGSDDWKLGGYKSRDLKAAGCFLFSFAHAYQWTTCEQTDDDFLRKLVKACSDPNGDYDHPTCEHGEGDPQDFYLLLCQEKMQTTSKPKETYDSIRSLFAKRGAVIIHAYGHYAIAVEEKTINKVSYTHIIDSSWGTFQRKAGGKLSYYKITGETVTEIKYDGYPKYPDHYHDGSHYWMKTDELFKQFALEDAWIPKLTWIDETSRIAVSIKDSTASDTCRLQSAPYDDSKYYTGKVEKGGVIYIKGAVKNSYGNTWYVTEDNLYVYKGDVEITEADASFSAKTAADFVGVVKTKDGYLKKKPFEAADHIDGGIVAKGKTVTIVGKVTNSHNNVWYVTDKGYYIYSGDVTTYVSEDLFHIKATFKNTEKRASHVVPYLDSDEKNTIKKDANVTVTKFVTNSHGNIWAQLEDGSYLCFYDKETGENKLKFISVSQKTTVSGFPTSSSDSGYPGYPTGDRDPKTSCALRGTIKSVVPMLRIEARVTNLSTNKEVLSVTAKPKYDLRSAKINGDITNRDGTKTNINNKMSFSKVADDGYYVYEIAVQHGFVYEGKTFTFGDETVVFDSNFTVGDPEEPLPDAPEPTKKPTGTQIGTTTKVWGDAYEDGQIDMRDALVIMQYISGWQVDINEVNADAYSDGNVDMRDALIIMQYISGWNIQVV